MNNNRIKISVGFVAVMILAFCGFANVAKADVLVDNDLTTSDPGTSAVGPAMVWTSTTTGYMFFADGTGGIGMASTTNGGTSWSTARNVDSVNTADAIAFAVWYDRWTPGDTTGNIIHIATLDTGVDDTYYTQLNTSTGAFSTTVLATTQGATATAGANYVAITKAVNGVIYMASADTSDSWVVSCTSTCTTAANWSERASAFGTTPDVGDDVPFLMPILGTNNVLLTYWDVSADTIDYNVYSATSSSWWFTAVPNAITAADDNTTYEGQMIGMANNPTTGVVYLTFVDDANDYTTADHDIKFWTFLPGTATWSQKTDAITTATGGLTAAKVVVDTTRDTNRLYVVYARRGTIGTATSQNVYYRYSADGGTTWSAESSAINTTIGTDDLFGFGVSSATSDRIGVYYKYTTNPNADDLYYADVQLFPISIRAPRWFLKGNKTKVIGGKLKILGQ